MDYGDEKGWIDAFTPDAVFDVVDVVEGSQVHREEGHEDLAAYVAAYPKPPQFRKHVIVDPVIDVDLDVVGRHELLRWADPDQTEAAVGQSAATRGHDGKLTVDGTHDELCRALHDKDAVPINEF